MKRLLFLAATALMAMPLSAQKYGATPEDSIECIKNLSIYQEFYKQKAYVDAYPAWKEVLRYCPSTSKNTYIRGNVILKQKIAKTTNEAEKQQYIAELMQLWDQRIQYYGEPSYCAGQKGSDMQTYMPDALDEQIALFSTAMADKKEIRNYAIPFLNLRAVIESFKASKATKDDILDAYERGIELLEIYQSATEEEDAKVVESMAGMDALLEPYASCTELVPLYEKKFADNKTKADFLKKATGMLDKRGCTDADIFFKMTEALHKIEPTPQSAYLMAKMCYAKKDFNAAINYVKDHVDALDKDSEKINALMVLADSYMNTNQYANGRAACLKALEINANEGRAYLMLGAMYAAGAKACGSDPIGQRAAFWVAVDTYVKAKQVDPSVSEKADNLISTYRGYFPSGDDLFTYGYKEGESYTINCWFSATTTIRAR